MRKTNINKATQPLVSAPVAAPEVLFSVIPASGNYARGALKITTGAGFVTKQAPFWRALIAAVDHPETRAKLLAKLAESEQPAAAQA